MSAKASKEDIMARLAVRSAEHFRMCHNCAQATLLALQEQFNMADGPATVRAAAFMPGVGGRGDTCGAISGALMALGLAFAPEKLDDFETRRRVRDETARVFCQKLEKEFGSLMCRDIQRSLFGRSFDFASPEDRAEFAKAGGYDRCSIPCEKAVITAAGIIMERKV